MAEERTARVQDIMPTVHYTHDSIPNIPEIIFNA